MEYNEFCDPTIPGQIIFASGANDWLVKVWTIDENRKIRLVRQLAGHTNFIRSLRFLDYRMLASCSHDGTIRIWDAVTGVAWRSIMAHARQHAMDIYPITKRIMTSCSGSGDIGVRHIVASSVSDSVREKQTTRLPHLALQKTTTQTTTTTKKQPVCYRQIWDLQTGERLRYWKGHESGARRIRAVHCGDHQDGWDWVNALPQTPTAPDELLPPLPGMSARQRRNTLLVTVSYDSTAKIWSLEQNRCLRTIDPTGPEMCSIWIHPIIGLKRNDAIILIGTYNPTLQVWSFNSGLCLSLSRYGFVFS